MKKTYYIPTIEVVCLEMQVAVAAIASSKTEVPGAPVRLQGASPSGSVKAF